MAKTQHHHNNNNDDMSRKSSSTLDCCLPMPKPRSDVDYVRESQFLLWLWKMIEEISFSYEYEQYLRDGVILCRLMENVAPNLFNNNNDGKHQRSSSDGKGSSKKNFQPSNIIIEKGENKQQKSENIHRFLDACRQYGLNDTELFEVEDLLSMLDMPKVTKCLYRLGQFIAEKNADNKPLLGKPYDEWLNEQIEMNEKNIEYFGGSSNIRRRHGMPFGDDLLVSHVSTEFVKQRLNRNVNKNRIRRLPRDPLVQRQPSIPLANLKAIFTGECQPLQYNNNDQSNI